MANGGVPSRDMVEAECHRLGHKLGWRFLTCPERNIEIATVAMVTANPGGDKFEEPRWSVEKGCAYVIESWKDFPAGNQKLQLQVRRMFQIMNVKPEEALSGYLVPFRSPSWEDLDMKSDSICFGVDAWREVFRRTNVKTVVAFGKEIACHMTDILKAAPCSEHLARWGKQTIDVSRFGTGGRLIVLPHLSRFTLFNRPDPKPSEDAFRAALAEI